MSIPTQQARKIFTDITLEVYRENIPAPSFLRTFFETRTSSSLYTSIEVQRGTEYVASQVLREQKANMNGWDVSTEKKFKPPFYNEGFDITQMDKYDILFGSNNNVSANQIATFGEEVGMKYADLRATIERAKELQASQVFDTGTVVTKFGTNIDFGRRATSMVDVGASDATEYWGNTSADVEAQLIAGAEHIRNYGKIGVSEFNIVMSGAAFVDLKKTTFFKDLANFDKVQLTDITFPQKDAFGAALHGRISFGAYVGYIWTYDEVYETSAGVITRYWDEDSLFMVPVTGTRFRMAHGGFPQIMGNPAQTEGNPQFITYQAGEYGFNNYITEDKTSHIFEIKSAPLAVPVTVDMIYTATVRGTANPEQG